MNLVYQSIPGVDRCAPVQEAPRVNTSNSTSLGIRVPVSQGTVHGSATAISASRVMWLILMFI